jgi:modulator of drug activity B
MNAFTGMEPLESIHFYDVMKNANIEANLQNYQEHLTKLFIDNNNNNHESVLNSLSEV